MLFAFSRAKSPRRHFHKRNFGFARTIPLAGALFLSVVIFATGCAPKRDIVAKVGKAVINAADFKETLIRRYRTKEFAAKRTLEERKEVLKGLIDQKLKLQDAYRLGLDQDSTLQAEAEKAREQAAIQELYKVAILDAVIPEKEIRALYDKMGEEIKARHILFKTKADASEEELKAARAKAEKAYDELMAGADFDSLARQISEDVTTAQMGGKLGYFTWGRMVDEFQDAAFALKVGELSKPVKSSYGYHIILLEDRRPNQNRGTYEEERDTILRMMLMPRHKSELDSARDAYIEALKKEHELKFNYGNIQRILDKISDPSVPRNNSLFSDFSEAEKQWVVATMKDDTIRVTDLDEYIAKTSRPPKWRDQKAIISVVERMVIPDFLKQRAKQQGLYKSKAAQKAYRDALERGMLKNVEEKQVKNKINLSDSTLLAYYQNHLNDFKTDSTVEVQEIYIKLDKAKGHDEAFAKKIARRAKRGQNFSKLVHKYSERKSALSRDGKLGPLTSRQYGALGQKAFHMKIGEISDPIKMGKRGFSIIKLLNKTPSRVKTFEEAKSQVERQLRMQQSDSLRNAWMADLKQRYPVTVYDDRLMAVLPAPPAADTSKAATPKIKEPVAVQPKAEKESDKENK